MELHLVEVQFLISKLSRLVVVCGKFEGALGSSHNPLSSRRNPQDPPVDCFCILCEVT